MGESLSDRRYTREHEWVSVNGDTATVGITHFAQELLGDLVYFDLPDLGTMVRQFAKIGEVESVKAVSDIFSPVSGEVIEINPIVAESAEVVNHDPYDKGWLLKVKLTNPVELNNLLSAAEYNTLIAESEKH